MDVVIFLFLLLIVLSSIYATRDARSFLFNPKEYLSSQIVDEIRNSTIDHKTKNIRPLTPQNLQSGDYYHLSQSTVDMDGQVTFWQIHFNTERFFSDAKIDFERIEEEMCNTLSYFLKDSILYLVIAFLSIFGITLLLLKWFVYEDFDFYIQGLHSLNLVLKGLPFGVMEYFFGSVVDEPITNQAYKYVKLASNFLTSTIAIGGGLQIWAIYTQRKTFQEQFDGNQREVNLAIILLIFTGKIEEMALTFRKPDRIEGGQEGLEKFNKSLNSWRVHQRNLIDRALENHLQSAHEI